MRGNTVARKGRRKWKRGRRSWRKRKELPTQQQIERHQEKGRIVLLPVHIAPSSPTSPPIQWKAEETQDRFKRTSSKTTYKWSRSTWKGTRYHSSSGKGGFHTPQWPITFKGQNGRHQEDKRSVLARMWRKRKPWAPWVGTWVGAATMRNYGGSSKN